MHKDDYCEICNSRMKIHGFRGLGFLLKCPKCGRVEVESIGSIGIAPPGSS